ncbi:hypothetical protein J5U22_00566 [Saccharolobus shibatae]|uniref:Uncharacterized protein n=1 Tax=Saccharolobus shibatae TaxID=2286 RepID=A0A8F5GYE8_9CREN|nr:hypothetical protein J5U22_00566 [Saccharolobus shibatae]
MELITIDEKALYGTPLNEAVKELGQNLTLVQYTSGKRIIKQIGQGDRENGLGGG